MNEHDDQRGPDQAAEDKNTQPSGQPAVQRDPERDVRQLARCLAIGAVRACTAGPVGAVEPDKGAEVGVVGPNAAPNPHEAESA